MAKKDSEKPDNLRDLLTVSEAADYLGVSASTLRNWDRSGKLNAQRHPINGYRLYKRGQLKRILNAISDFAGEVG